MRLARTVRGGEERKVRSRTWVDVTVANRGDGDDDKVETAMPTELS
jgi:hypothetical protein